MKSISQKKIKMNHANPKWPFLFVTGILLGILLVLFNKDVFLQDTYFFGEDVLKRFSYSSIYQEPFFFYVLKNRMGMLLFLLVASLTVFCVFVLHLFWLWFGAGMGAVLATLLCKYQMKGTIIFFALFLPHDIIYIPSLFALSSCLHGIYKRFHGKSMVYGDGYEDNKTFILKRIIVIFILIILFFIGTFLESYVNPILLKKFLKNF